MQHSSPPDDPLSPLLLDQDSHIAQAFYRAARVCPEAPVYSYAVLGEADARHHRTLCYREVEARINRLAHYLGECGVGEGTKVAILSNTRPEWMEADLAIVARGGVTVSVYQSLPAQDVGYILFDSGADVVFVENQEQLAKILYLLSQRCPIPATEERAATEAQLTVRRIISFEFVEPHEKVVSLQDILDRADPGPPPPLGISRTALASLVYTSGTTGPPKGVMQTHGNHLANIRQAFQAGMYRKDTSIFLLLPLAHSFAKLMGYIGFLTSVHLRFPAVVDKRSSKADPASVLRDMREANANLIPLVPRILEKIEEGIRKRATAGGVAGWLVFVALRSATERYRARQAGQPVSWPVAIGYALTRGVRARIGAKIFGVNFRNVISGGAKLPPTVAHFFAALGLEILEGYGLTETCVATNVNRSGRNKIGSVGPVMASDIECQIGADGEIRFRGPNVALGYYNRKSATDAVWDAQGWFATGDLGSIDKDGYLSIVGRKKELIVSSNGKKIAPDPIEQRLKGSPYISQVVIFGDARPHCVALVVPNLDAVRAWGGRQGVVLSGELHTNEQVVELIWSEVEQVNASLAGFEQIRKVALIGEEFTVENGMLTPTFKVKRSLVEVKYREQIEKLYQ